MSNTITKTAPSNAEMARGIEICMNEWDRMKAVWIAKFGNTDGFREHFSREVGILSAAVARDNAVAHPATDEIRPIF